MPAPFRITTLEEIESAIDKLVEDPNSVIPEITDDLVLTIKIDGATWDGFIDVRVAKYVAEVQRAVDRACRIAGSEKVPERQFIKVKIKPGSTDLETRAVDIFEKLIANMTDEHKFIIALAVIGCAFAGWSLKKVLEHLDDRHKRKLERESANLTVQEMSTSLKFALEKIDPEKPIRTLVKDLETEDRISLPAVPEPALREEAVARYPRRRRVTPIDVLIDDTYDVDSVTLDFPRHLNLRKNDVTFRGEFSNNLGTEDRDRFVAEVRSALENSGTVRVSLQIDARIGDRVIQAVIVGIGKPARTNSKDLVELIE